MTSQIQDIRVDPTEAFSPPAPAPAEELVQQTPGPTFSRRELRRQRRRRRNRYEELLGWVLVPLIIVGSYWLVIGALDALGTSPSAILNGLNTIASSF